MVVKKDPRSKNVRKSTTAKGNKKEIAAKTEDDIKKEIAAKTEDDIKKEVGARIKEVYEGGDAAGISRAELAKLIGVTTTMIGFYLNGTKSPSYRKLLLICLVCGANPGYVIDGEEPKYKGTINENTLIKQESDMVNMMRMLDDKAKVHLINLVFSVAAISSHTKK